MRKIYLQIAISFLIMTSTQFAAAKENGRFGLGVVVGGPTAMTGKYWLSREAAIDGGLAFSYSDYVLVYGDYLKHYPRPFKNSDPFFSNIDFYMGVGANLVVTTNDRYNNDNYLGKKSGSVGLGVRVPFGLEWQPADPPIGVFLEIVPGISVIPSTSVVVQGGLGIRYYF